MIEDPSERGRWRRGWVGESWRRLEKVGKVRNKFEKNTTFYYFVIFVLLQFTMCSQTKILKSTKTSLDVLLRMVSRGSPSPPGSSQRMFREFKEFLEGP